MMWASHFRDDVPWLYEMSVEVYRVSLSGDLIRLRQVVNTFLALADFALNGPWTREIRGGRQFARVMMDMLHQTAGERLVRKENTVPEEDGDSSDGDTT
jgi:hypothetical protein